MRCIGTTRSWLFFEHANSVVAVDSVSLDTTGVINGESADALIASSVEQEWRVPDHSPSLDAATILASSVFADSLPPSPTFPLPITAALGTIEHTVPEEASQAARQALKWRRDHRRGSNDKICSDNARMLAQGGSVSLDKVRNIALHWAIRGDRHGSDGWDFGTSGYPSAERIDWGLWGGEAGNRWARSALTASLGPALLAAVYDIDAGMVDDEEVLESESLEQDPLKDHQFEPQLGGTLCMYCGKSELDRIHDFLAPTYSVLDTDPDKSHFFVSDTENFDKCGICSRDIHHDLHRQAALASYYEFKDLYDQIYAEDAKYRTQAVSAGAVVSARPEEDLVERAAEVREMADDLFWERQGTEDDDPLTYYVSHVDDDEMVVDGVYVFDGKSFYSLNAEQRLWMPTDLPSGEHVYPIDDESAYVTINALLFASEPFDLHEVDPGESCLMDSCVPHVDLDTYSRGLVSDVGVTPAQSAPASPAAPAQGGPWVGYTQEERSKNASRQGRDATGRFAPGGGGGGEPKGAPAPGGKSKAKIANPRPALSAPELKALFDGFAAYVQEQRTAAQPESEPEPQTAAAETEVAPAPAPTETPTASPEQSDVKPINLAIMDPGDPSAVLDLVSLVPASATSVVPKLFKRVAGNTWDEDLVLLRQMQSLHPPIVQTLDDNQYSDVLAQVDQYYADQGGGATAPAPGAFSLYGPYGEIVDGGFFAAAPSLTNENAVIVAAIPRDDDSVWAASSEPKPHMTLLFFGEAAGADLESIRTAIGDIAASFSGPITCPVKERQDLGDDNADVVMLEPELFASMREDMLSNPAVRAAYDAVEQYPEWKPHLTLGYPETPAKDEPPNEVVFDRIALWDNNYSGTEYSLGSNVPVQAAGIPGIADTPSDIAAVEKLKRYWTVGRGGTIKIRWNTPGDWSRCNKHLRKYMGPRAKGYCANLHKLMTGVWPGDRRNIGKRKRHHFSLLGDPYDVLSTEEVISAAAAFAEVTGGSSPLTAAAVAEAGGAHFVIPVLAPVKTKSGDGRAFAPDALSYRDLPIPLLWQIKTQNGHDESVIVGRIDSIDTFSDGSLGNARGVFDIGAYGQEAERMVRDKFLRGVSVDLDEFEAEAVGDGTSENDSEEDVTRITPGKMIITSARAMAATLVAKPAFQECTIEIDDDAEEITMVADGTYIADPSTDEEFDALVKSALTAAGFPLHPPREWFDDPGLTEKTPLTVHEDGRIFGHIATWDVDHIGLPFSTRPPKSSSNYAYFHTGVLRTEDGSDVTVGQLTLVGGHASLDANAAAAARHYDDTASAFADVHAGEDKHGIWVAGALRTTVTGEQLRAIRASAPSGDWRPINGRLEMVAVCQVNTPGFPTTRARVASGQIYALVAAGTTVLNRLRADRAVESDGLSEIAARLAVLEDERSKKIEADRAAVVERVNAIRASVTDRHRQRMTELSSRVDVVREERAERDRQHITALVDRVFADVDGASLFKDYSSEKREEYTKKGWALKDGSYPIANVADLRRAIHAYGRAKQKAPVRRHIRKRAKALGKSELIPESWGQASMLTEEFAAMAVESPDEALFKDYSTETREEYSKKGWAMKGGRYPIANVGDLRRAIHAYGRGNPDDKPAIRRHIRKRARALGKTDMIPESWGQASMLTEEFSAMALEPADESMFRDYSSEKREEYAKKGWALPDGSYPIANVGDLKNAIRAFGRGGGNKAKIRRHIRKRARALGKTDLLPESWSTASLMITDGFDELTELFGPLIAAGGRYPDGTPWDPKRHPRDERGRFREAIARIREAAVKAKKAAIVEAADAAQRAEEEGNLDAAQEAARRVLKRVDEQAGDIADIDTADELRKGYTDLGSAVANLPLTMGDLNEKFRFTELPEDLQGLIEDLLTRVESRLEPELAEKASSQIKRFISGLDLLSQPEISAELSRMLRYLI